MILDILEQEGMAGHRDLGETELPNARGFDRAAELRRHRLHPITDTEHRHTERKHWRGRRDLRRQGDGFRAAREHDAARLKAPDPLVGEIVGMDLAVDTGVPYAPGDELGSLRAEIEDEDAIAIDICHGVPVFRRGR